MNVTLPGSLPWVRPWLLRLAASVERFLAVPTPSGRDEINDLVVARAKNGDHQAFSEIVRYYDERLRRLAFRLLDDRDRMDDVLQEAYVKAYRGLPAFKGTARLGTWLYRITYNACIDELRRKPALTLATDTAAEQPSLARGPDEIASDRTALAGALRSLPSDQRAAVLLVDADGFDYAAAADILGVRAGTVASRLSRARVALRRALEEH